MYDVQPKNAPKGRPVQQTTAVAGTDEELPQPKVAEDGRNLLLGAARNAVRLRNWEVALARFQEYFRRFGSDDVKLLKECAGVLVQAGRVQEGLREYQNILQRFPDDPDVRIAYADLLLRTRDYGQAIRMLAPALQHDRGNLELATRLARVHVFNEDFPRALQIFDEHLAKLKPGDEKVPLAFPALLVDLERPGDALAFLQAMLAQQPGNLELLATRVRAHARLGDSPRALEALQSLADKGPESLKVRLDLGDTLFVSEDLEVAAAVFTQVLQGEPGNGEALVGLARVFIQQYEPRQARALLEGFRPTPEVQRRYWQAWAEYHHRVGEYADTKRIYERFLHEDQNDDEIRLSLGALYEEPLREDERAKAEYGKIAPTAAQYRRARVGIAATLTNQRLFLDAIGVCKTLLTQCPNDGNAIAQWARTLAKAKRHGEAVDLCRSFLEANPRNVPAVRSVRLALGTVLLDARHPGEAYQEFQQVLAMPGGRIPATWYGLARAAEIEGNSAKSQQILSGAAGTVASIARHWILMADFYCADAEDLRALEMTKMVLRGSPDNLAALIRVVTAQSRLARFSGNADETVATAKTILAASPSNVRARLEMARALASARQFSASIHTYEDLIAIDPTARLPRRERARMLQSDHQYAAAQAAYQELQSQDAESQFHNRVETLAERDPTVRRLTAPALPADLACQLPQAQWLPTVEESDPDAGRALNRLSLDRQATSAEHAQDHLEAEVKDKDWQHREMLAPAQTLLQMEPSNTSVLFDLGQDYGNLRATRRAMDAFQQDLLADPHEREAGIALERAGLELSPQGALDFDYFHQFGRQFLAAIGRFRFGGDVRIPYGDEDEYVHFGFARADYVPTGGTPLEGNIISGGFQAKAFDRFYASGTANIEDFQDRLKPRVTFDTGVRYDFCDLLHARLGTYLNNVVENSETLRQDIYRYGARAGVDLSLTRNWSADATYTYGHYSDNNDFNEAFVRSQYFFCFPPTELKAVLSGDLLNYRSSTVFKIADPTDLVGIEHPYFSPHLFVYYEARLSWKHWLSRDYFTYANQCWYNLEYATGWDNNLFNYNTFRAQFNADIKSWLTVGVEAQVTLCPVYNAQQALAYLVLRWP
jgi:tetratricopeptide (TPR) repeat protein